jgi:hypothetical protein
MANKYTLGQKVVVSKDKRIQGTITKAGRKLVTVRTEDYQDYLFDVSGDRPQAKSHRWGNTPQLYTEADLELLDLDHEIRNLTNQLQRYFQYEFKFNLWDQNIPKETLVEVKQKLEDLLKALPTKK